ncbi:hypothetical protein OCU04_012687 [Sclerotinia nivalis]|uniref:Uncharacterized protein n=1 Tax=Sclerotinia nivalis TaxID=352851 RepID=A0A9X0A932_9HELO|nr:hypothetical protein OCU04_012687 [Sclerotinia nivalis]
MHKSGGIVGMSKRNFWMIFKVAWAQSATTHNILKSFEKAGIYPINKNVTIRSIEPKRASTPPTSIQLAGNKIKTLYTTKTLRHLKLEFRLKQDPDITQKLFKAAFTNAANANIQLHRAKGLEEALKIERKKRTRSKRLNLVGEEGGGAFLYSPSQIERARAYQSTKALAAEQEKEAKKQEKAEKKVEREQRDRATKERVAQREVDRQIGRDTKEGVKRARKSLIPSVKRVQMTPKRFHTIGLVSKEATKDHDVVEVDKSVVEGEEGVLRSRAGRYIKISSKLIK